MTITDKTKQKFHFIPDDVNASFLAAIKDSSPSDYIMLTMAEDQYLSHMWEEYKKIPEGMIGIPSDLFFSQIIPLLDCLISVDERGENFGSVKGEKHEFRVVIFDWYQEVVQNALARHDTSLFSVGAIIPFGLDPPLYIPINCVVGNDYISYAGIGWMSKKGKDILNLCSFDDQTIIGMVVNLLQTWYGIQLSLLHPQIKTVFQNPMITAMKEPIKNEGKKKKRKVKYLKRHILNLDEMKASLSAPSGTGKKYSCMAWYVIGHWRHYASGKVGFVKPYWKGALRNLKSNAVGDDRERIIESGGKNDLSNSRTA